jgi:hypothetical protein
MRNAVIKTLYLKIVTDRPGVNHHAVMSLNFILCFWIPGEQQIKAVKELLRSP